MLKFTIPLLLSPLLKWPESSSLFIILSFLLLPKFYMHSSSFLSLSNLTALDQLSTPLIILTMWTSSLMLMASTKTIMNNNFHKEFNSMVSLLLLVLLMSFMINNLMMYYIFFEASLIPTLMLILGWGYQPERLQASMYLMIYTVTASLPLLASLQVVSLYNYSLFMMFSSAFMPAPMSIFMSIFLALAFLVKMPMYISHLWLPKAHVEAPVAGSMILAGILLKLGSYGLLRLMMFTPKVMNLFNSTAISLSMWGSFMTAMICLRQQDMKSLIAYSSVGHMALLISGMYSMSKWGWEGAVVMMLAHGLSSSSLFALANMKYETSNTRSMLLNKGMLFLTPTITLWWFMASAANMGAPPSLNLMAEILLMTSILYTSMFTILPLALSAFLAAAYSLILFTSPHHGTIPQSSNPQSPPSNKTHIISSLHLIPLFIFMPSSYLISSLI